ncbi:hypothetical protein PMIN06_000777 [Paraphaeosphaeria minitans]
MSGEAFLSFISSRLTRAHPPAALFNIVEKSHVHLSFSLPSHRLDRPAIALHHTTAPTTSRIASLPKPTSPINHTNSRLPHAPYTNNVLQLILLRLLLLTGQVQVLRPAIHELNFLTNQLLKPLRPPRPLHPQQPLRQQAQRHRHPQRRWAVQRPEQHFGWQLGVLPVAPSSTILMIASRISRLDCEKGGKLGRFFFFQR